MVDTLLKQYAVGISILCVEDDPVSSTIICKMLEPYFARIYTAENGAEGLRQFHLLQPELIVTDLMMPVVDGIEMLREIRKSDQKTRVVLMTASLDYTHLVEAINLGVSKFLPKPLYLTQVQQAIFGVVRELYLERVAERARQQEVELLQYRNRYHSSQVELAQAKERHIVINQFKQQFLAAEQGGGWLTDIVQHSRDIMSGDSYSIVAGANNTLLVFLADAMGHGLSASVTSMLVTSFFNHAVQKANRKGMDFKRLSENTLEFAAGNLLEDEVFCGLLLELDPARQMLRCACFGMPALLMVRGGQVERQRGANPPVSSYTTSLLFQEFSLEGVSDILLATDGLSEAVSRDGGWYRDHLEADLLATATAGELFERYKQTCADDEHADDITIIRLSAIGAGGGKHEYQYRCPGSLEGINRLQAQVRLQLEGFIHDAETLDMLDLAMSEALLNAFEHGCLKMGADKRRLILDDEYDRLVAAADNDRVEGVSVVLTVVPRGNRLQIWLELTDPGAGYDDGQTVYGAVDAPAGRGLVIMRRSVDLVRRNSVGNRLVLMKMAACENLPAV